MGAKNALSWVTLCGVISLFVLSLLSQLELLVLVFLLYSFFGSAVWSPVNTIVAKVTPEAERGLGYSVYFFVEGLLGSLTPTLAAGVIELTDVWFIFPFSLIFFIASLVVLQLLAYPRRR